MARDVYAEITARIIEAIERGAPPWRQQWSAQAAAGTGGMPCNAVSGRPYSGVNVPLLWLTAQERGYTSPRWLTYKQATEAGGHVRKGEKSTVVVFVNTFAKPDSDDADKLRRIPFLKTYLLFNVAQCDDLPARFFEARKIIYENADERDAALDEMIVATGATIKHGEARAYYRPAFDYVNMPAFTTFRSSDAYYSTLFHELIHWTGAGRRLDRHKKGARFGGEEYAFEEMVAELGAAFVCAEYGIDQLDQHAGYLDHWVKVLKDHSRMFVAAASAASAAVAYIKDTVNAADPVEVEEIAA